MPNAQAVTLRQNPVYPAPQGSWRGHSLKSSLQAIAGRIAEGGQREGVVRMLDDLLRPLDPERSEDQLVGAIAAALRKRAVGARANVGNLYLHEDELQHMRLYTLLRERVPMISMTHPLANELLLPHVSAQEQVVILDIGTGNGEQLADLIHLCGTRDAAPRRLVVVGLDLSAPSLANAQRNLSAAAERWGIDFRFIALNKQVEALTDEDWTLLDSLEGTRVVNATFALHHLRHDDAAPDVRDRLFQRLRRWRPRTLVISETDAEFNTVPLPERTGNVYDYFLGMFQHIDALDIPEGDRLLLKLGMVAREIEDILGPNEEERCERYESGRHWRERLERAGFALTPPPPSLTLGSNEAITITVDRGYVTLHGAGTSLVAILCARPVDG
ncbi:GRAS family protein [Archangium violaceum]|uniref:GRAS family protein n=1 Tax=Archangium violaceum TaxID=83451 RepID=UPI002B28E3C1|nr:GRAS family protein [Archangium violaceum]